MRFKITAAVAAILLVGIVASQAWKQPSALAQDPPARQRIEYKVVFSPVEHVEVKETRKIEGKLKEIDHGPKASAEAMTKQFNALAAEGWDYVGAVTPTGKTPTGKLEPPGPGDGESGVLTVFKRAKQ